MKYDLNALKSEVDVMGVLRQTGMDVRMVRGKISAICPFHPDHRHGSCYYDNRKKNFHCYSCGKSFDVFDAVQQMTGLAQHEAYQYVADYTGWGERYALSDAKIKEEKKKKDVQKAIPWELLEALGLMSLKDDGTPDLGSSHSSGAIKGPYEFKMGDSRKNHVITCSNNGNMGDITEVEELEMYSMNEAWGYSHPVFYLFSTDPAAMYWMMDGKCSERWNYYDDQRSSVLMIVNPSNKGLVKAMVEYYEHKMDLIEAYAKSRGVSLEAA